MLKVLLLGMEGGVAEKLSAALPSDRFSVRRLAACEAAACLAEGVDLLCLPGESAKRRPLLDSLGPVGAAIRFVAVGPRPSPREWLEAVKQGAVDYLEPPFDSPGLPFKFDAAVRGAPMRAFLCVQAEPWQATA